MIKIEKVLRPKQVRGKNLTVDFLLGAVGSAIMFFLITYTAVFMALISPKPANNLSVFLFMSIGWPILTVATIKIWWDYFYSSTTISWGNKNKNSVVIKDESLKEIEEKPATVNLPDKEELNQASKEAGDKVATPDLYYKNVPRWEKLPGLPEDIEYILIGMPPRNYFIDRHLFVLVRYSQVDIPIVGRDLRKMDVRVILMKNEEIDSEVSELGDIVARKGEKLVFIKKIK
jgi:hypothetical protein